MTWLNADRVAGLFSIVVGLSVLALIPYQVTVEPIPGTGDYVSFSPAAVPRICAASFLAVGLMLLALPSAPRTLDENKEEFGDHSLFDAVCHVTVVVTMLAVYAGILEWLGYLASTVLFLVALNLYAGTRRVFPLLLGAGAFPVFIYYFFGKVLLIPLPEGVLFG